MSDVLWSQTAPAERRESDLARVENRRRLRSLVILTWVLRGVCLGLVGWAAVVEAQTSFVQSAVISRLAKGIGFSVQPGPSDAIRFPAGGPYDERLGYARLPALIEALTARRFVVEQQSRFSPELNDFVAAGGFALFREKTRAGLTLLDRAGTPLHAALHPARAYGDFASIPPLVVNTLLYIEDRHLLDNRYPQRNPAVEWNRFMAASAGRAAAVFDPRFKEGGASTLATQIEKFRHSPAGRTGGIDEKLKQMITASARAYLDGPETKAAREHILTAYLDSTPLSSRPAYGEIIGLPEGLWAWYGTETEETARVLNAPAETDAALARKGEVYRQVLSMLLAQRRPSYYLAGNREALGVLTNQYLGYLYDAGVIDALLRDAATKAELRVLPEPPAPDPVSFAGRKAADTLRTRLLSLLRVPNFYSLDRLDLTAETTLDAAAQNRVNGVLSQLGDRKFVASAGMVAPKLLGNEDPSRVTYSVVLYERGADRNMVRIHADSLDGPFDVNSGAKLILGSTAKLRTLVTYLNVIAELHGRLGELPPGELSSAIAAASDPLTRWAASYLSATSDRRLQPMLDAAMERRYSGSPNESFFTGGGLHSFHNFEKKEDYWVTSVTESFKHSVNLAFIRIMRDISHYYIAREGDRTKGLLTDRQDPGREAYLRRFADQEGREFLGRFYADYRGRTPDEALAMLVSHIRPVPRRVAIAFRSARPQATVAEFKAFISQRLPSSALEDNTIESLYASYSVDKLSLSDRGYLLGAHPLELWLASYLQEHPGATRAELMKESADARQEVYGWLYKTRNKAGQDTRIRILLEEDAFDQILQDWRKQGYAFDHLVPSLATAIGSSGDRPDSLAELMGIILNNGVKLPTVEVERLHFASGTPYQTDMSLAPEAPKQVILPEIASTVRRSLAGVVAQGTGTRIRNAFTDANGAPLPVGGKTGTGDNRYDRYGPGGQLISSRVVDRTGTFVFFIGDRFFGTVTAYVAGAEAANYGFSSALAVQLLKALSPELAPLINMPATPPGPPSAIRHAAREAADTEAQAATIPQ
jgi:membrane peptidoglycan carboxypeptidase